MKKLDCELATIVNVPELVNVWIVCPPLVVIVPPVDAVETQSDQFVAYDIITIPLHPEYQAANHALETHPPPQPVFAVPALPFPVLYASQFPQPPVHHNPLVVYPPPPPQQYVTDAPDMEFAVPFQPAPQVHQPHAVPLAPTADEPHHPLVADTDAQPALPVPCEAVELPAVPAGQAHQPLHQLLPFKAPLHIPAHQPHHHNAVLVANIELVQSHH